MSRFLAAAAALVLAAAATAETARYQLSTNHGVKVERQLPFQQTGVLVEFKQPVDRRVFAKFRGDLAQIERRSPVANGAGHGSPLRAEIRHEYSMVWFGVAVSASAETIESLRALPYVRAVTQDRLMYATQVKPADFGRDAAQRVNAASLPTRGRGMTIAVIDTGIDYRHVALGGGFGPGYKVAGGYDFIGKDDDPLDDAGHGTHVAGIIAADGAGLTGVAPEATLLAYKVLDAGGSGPTSAVLAAIERAVDPNGDGDSSDHVDVINLSLGAPGHPDDEAAVAVDKAVDAGVIVVAAAGNEGRTMSIGSPGAARKAITVGAFDEYDQVAFFSSKGPTAKAYTFKPDLVAPGNLIISAAMGGGTVAKSGTSMAAPHVAGAAALLKALHPDWTPSDIKAALASSAKPLLRESDPMHMGSGKLDVAAASDVTLMASDTGISFGINTGVTGQWSETRKLRITNRSNKSETLSVVDMPPPTGMTLTISPKQLTLGAGESGELTLIAKADNAKLENPISLSLYSRIRVGTTIGVEIPWALIRASRAVVKYDQPYAGGDVIELWNLDTSISLWPSDANTAEAILPPGKYDLIMQLLENPDDRGLPRAMRVIVSENVDVTGDKMIAISRASAPHRLTMNALDPDGRPLASLEHIRERRERSSTVRLSFRKTSADMQHVMDASFSLTTPTITEVHTSTLSNAFRISLAEAYLDADNGRGYVVSHPVAVGVKGAATYTNDPSKFVHATVRANHPEAPHLRKALGACLAIYDTRQFGTTAISGGCVMNEANANGTFEVYATPDATPDAHVAAQPATYYTRTPPLRAFGGEMVATEERFPSGRDQRVPNHGQITIGLGPFYPMIYFATAGVLGAHYHHGGILGPFGEVHLNASEGNLFTMWDADGNVVASGIHHWRDFPPIAQPGWRFRATIEHMMSKARWSNGTVDVQFGSNPADLVAPLITSLSVRNASGNIVDRLSRGEQATLHFSGGNHTLGGFPRIANDGSKPAATKAWWRVSGTAEWQPLAVTVTGAENAARSETGFWPAGEFYRADVTAATAVDNSLVDLKLELEDPSGNRLTWTHERAIMIGTVEAPPPKPKRRSIG